MPAKRRTDRSSYPVRKTTLREQDVDDLENTTPAERLGMMWQLTLDAWAFTGQPLDESRLPRHIVGVVRSPAVERRITLEA
jgi:hypothetical protein